MYASTPDAPRKPLTVPALAAMKASGEPIAVLTCYDASFARVLDGAGIDAVLVGDSLGMVVKGESNTLAVTVDDIVYHCRAVSRGLSRALLIADMPFLAEATVERAIASAHRMVAEGGAAMVKIEGGRPSALQAIEALASREVPVCAHIGLTPQSVLALGGFKVQGREEAARAALLAQADAVVAAGAQLLVLECVPTALGDEITRRVPIPTIGIGAGPGCDGQVLVLHDLLGVSGGRRPRFVKDFLAEGGSVHRAIERYVAAVKTRAFPAAEHGY
jgi:3-methyl-2-oxobutanoate hydroxymethyltransferase